MMRLVAGIVTGLCLASVALAQTSSLPAPGSVEWRSLKFAKIERDTLYTVVDNDGLPAFRAEARASASALYVAADPIGLTQSARLRWRWRIERGLQVADERSRGGDDFAARVYAMFRFDPERASMWQQTQHRLALWVYGDPIPGSALCYVWTSSQPRGSSWDNPYTDTVKMVARGSGVASEWSKEEVDLLADYRAHFGRAAPPLLGVAIMSDSDNTAQHAVAWYADFQLESTAASVAPSTEGR